MSKIKIGLVSLTNFKRQTAEYLRKLHSSRDPMVLTVNGKAQAVVQDAAAYQSLLERASKVDGGDAAAAIREGLADAGAGRVAPAPESLQALARKYGLPVPVR